MALRGAAATWFDGLRLLLLVALTSRVCSAANILCLLPTPTPSHHIWSSPLVVALAARGHNLTVLSPTAMKSPVPNVTDLVIEGALDYQDQEYDYEDIVGLDPISNTKMIFEWYVTSCKYTLTTKGVRQLYEYPDDFKFDLIIIEATGGECLLGFVEKFGRPPVVAVNGFGNPQWLNWNAGNPDHPAYVSNFQLTLRWPFAFHEKVTNVFMYLFTMYNYYWHHLPELQRMLQEHFASAPWVHRTASVADTLRNISMVLVNGHYSIDGARPMVPGVIPIAGLQIRPPKALPKELQQWLDGASEADGAVLFSLGSLVRSDRIGKRQRDAVVAAFAALPKVRFLWKWESDAPPTHPMPPNVLLGKWLPQNDILAHPKLRAFITHAGMLSTHESTWRGVPVIALPFIVDQLLNAQRLQALGVGERLDYRTLTKEAMLDALTKVLRDPKYLQRMQQVSSLFRSRPQSPLDEAVFWVEHVLRHSGAPLIHCPAQSLAWYEMFLLDVAAVAVALFAALVIAAWCLLRAIKVLTAKKKKTE